MMIVCSPSDTDTDLVSRGACRSSGGQLERSEADSMGGLRGATTASSSGVGIVATGRFGGNAVLMCDGMMIYGEDITKLVDVTDSRRGKVDA